jgi:ABC-type multidrug transport system ATPase subunit
MEKLTRNGQAILCTVHQPSSLLFQRFDRILLLAKGGRTVYFGDIGQGSHVLLDYFARNGGPKYTAGQNPAEYMLAAIGAAPGAQTSIDWPQVWMDSQECKDRLSSQGYVISSTSLLQSWTRQKEATKYLLHLSWPSFQPSVSVLLNSIGVLLRIFTRKPSSRLAVRY